MSKSSCCHAARPRADRDAFLRHLVATVYQERPHYGCRRMAAEISVKYELDVGEGKVRAQMRRLGLRAIIRRWRVVTTVADPDGRRFPNLLRDLRLERSNQAWGSDITYTAAGGQRACVVSIKDLYSRKVLAWRVSNTMDVSFCLEALEEALGRYGRPEIFHSDQGREVYQQGLREHPGGGGGADPSDGQGAGRRQRPDGEPLLLAEVRGAQACTGRQPGRTAQRGRYFTQYNSDGHTPPWAAGTPTPFTRRAWTASLERLQSPGSPHARSTPIRHSTGPQKTRSASLATVTGMIFGAFVP